MKKCCGVFSLFVVALLLSGCGGGGAGSNGGGSNTPPVNPTPVTLVSITITPASATVAKGQNTIFAATGNYSDGTTANITNQATWSSGSTAVVTITSNAGIATGVAIGISPITAKLNGITSSAANLTVNAAVLTGISISPIYSYVPKGQPVTYTATGTYSDGTRGNISGSVNWQSSSATAATINASGIASSLSQGTTTITASTYGITSNSATLTMTAPALTTIAITPTSALVGMGLTTSFIATGTYTDGTTASITNQVTWASANTGVATINSATGVVTGIAASSTEVTASLTGITSPPASLTVTAAVMTGISISPSAPTTPQGTQVTFTATGTFSDGSTGNVSGSVNWASSNTNVAWLYSGSVFQTSGQGSTTISASVNGFASSATLTVTAPVLATLTISPSASNIILGGTQLFTAWSRMTDGTTAILGTLAWTSSGAAVATINGTGLATTLAFGSTNISASSGSITSNTALLTVQDYSGMFSATGSSGQARESHTATLLTNGKVLVAGGYSPTYELYDPTTGSTSSTGSMLSSRTYHTATLLPNGKVLVAGGYDNTNITSLNTAEIYDPINDIFRPVGNNLGELINSHTATLLLNGKVLIAGGEKLIAGMAITYSQYAYLYDPATNSFTSVVGMLTPRALHTATLLPNGKVLFTGGWGANGPVTSAELFDPATGSFSAVVGILGIGEYPTSTTLPNGKVLITGGFNGTSTNAIALLYDPATSIFSATGSMTSARVQHTATLLLNGKVLITGGQDINLTAPATRLVFGSAELYDPATGTFSATGSMTSARMIHTATLLPNGHVLVTGGQYVIGTPTTGVTGIPLSSAELFQ